MRTYPPFKIKLMNPTKRFIYFFLSKKNLKMAPTPRATHTARKERRHSIKKLEAFRPRIEDHPLPDMKNTPLPPPVGPLEPGYQSK
jgi:hypothetical protein